MRLSRTLAYTLFLALPLAACNCDDPLLTVNEEPDTGVSADSGEVPMPDAGDTTPDAGATPDAGPEARVLTFDGTSPVALFFGNSRDLRFLLKTVSGAVVSNETINFSLSGNAGTISGISARTDANGAGLVRFNAALTAGRSIVGAVAEHAPSINVTIDVTENPAANLDLIVSSATRIPVAAGDGQVYVGAPGVVPTCAQLFAATTLPATTHVASFTTLPATRNFQNLPTGSVVTAYAVGRNTRGDRIARGCTEGVRLIGGSTAQISVTLGQLPTDMLGDYDVLLGLDLGSTLPPPYDSTIILITDVISDPAGWAVYQALAAVDDGFGATFVEWVPPGQIQQRRATFYEVRTHQASFNTWLTARTALNDFLVAQLGQTYVDFTTVGADIAGAIRSLDVGARYTLSANPTPNRVDVHEAWQAIVFEWRINCPVGDLGCARRSIAMAGSGAQLAPVEADYGATVRHAPTTAPIETERFELDLDAHTADLQYGSLVLFMLNGIVFPSLPGNIAGNSLGQVLANIVNCTDVANSLGGSTGLPPAIFLNLCIGAVNSAATALENQILALNNNGNPSVVTGTNGGLMVLVDGDHDLRTELLPEITTDAAWSTANPPISTPVIGDGRRAASGCAADAQCATGLACVPVPSYLRVRAVEHDCRRAVGAALGAVGCAVNADCRSDWCLDPGTGVRVCYSACDASHACALGTCTTAAASYDLSTTLAGLGSASIAACVP